jgi:hypothetical protein
MSHKLSMVRIRYFPFCNQQTTIQMQKKCKKYTKLSGSIQSRHLRIIVVLNQNSCTNCGSMTPLDESGAYSRNKIKECSGTIANSKFRIAHKQ